MAHKSAGKMSAGKKKKDEETKRRASVSPWSIIFWITFFVLIFGLFAVNRGKIQQTLSRVQFFERGMNREPGGREDSQAIIQAPEESSTVPELTIEIQPNTSAGSELLSQSTSGEQIHTNPVEQTHPQQPVTVQGPSVLRERSLYLIRIDSEGSIHRIKVNRQLPVSETPMVDILNSLLAGPSREEQNQGLVSLIPRGSRVLTANTTVRGSTAYINFSEDLQNNIYGVEGHAASLRQIIWTVTEFPNIEDVQILIEGRRIDYLGEGIWIGSPINRRF
jgi:spore germination protein GerM